MTRRSQKKRRKTPQGVELILLEKENKNIHLVEYLPTEGDKEFLGKKRNFAIGWVKKKYPNEEVIIVNMDDDDFYASK